MISKCIGIISYLPNDLKIREHRKNMLNNLLAQCNKLFNLPIIIIAQNYSHKEIRDVKNKYDNVCVFDYIDKLGITGARKELRNIFLKSDYDYLIMLDDDCKLIGKSGDKYLEQIDENPDCFIEFSSTLLKLFAISKYIFSQLDYDNVNPELAEGFEDRVFVNKLRKLFKNNRREFKNTGIEQSSISTKDPYST